MQILFPLRGERLSNLVNFLGNFSPLLGGKMFSVSGGIWALHVHFDCIGLNCQC